MEQGEGYQGRSIPAFDLWWIKTNCLLYASSLLGANGHRSRKDSEWTEHPIRAEIMGSHSIFPLTIRQLKARPLKSPDSGHCNSSRAGAWPVLPSPSPETKQQGWDSSYCRTGEEFLVLLFLNFCTWIFLSTKLMFTGNQLLKFVLESIYNQKRR